MKVSIDWLKEFVDLKTSIERLTELIPLRIPGGISALTNRYFELDIKGYNRADLLSMRGVAYEIAAITGSPVKFKEPEPSEFIWFNQALPQANAKIENEKLAPVYCIAKIEGLKVQPSSLKWQEKLESSGVRAVNNVADVTNLVMLEYGQPLHAFDIQAVRDEAIIVRTAREGERITTLDGKTRSLTPADLLIADSQNALGIAGVMGGKDSEVSDSTTAILLEAAIFDPTALRRTATRLSLNSEAAKRFYHGLTKRRLFQALNAAIRMYEGMGGRLTALGIFDNFVDREVRITLNQQKINSLIGVEIKAKEVEGNLQRLHFDLNRLTGGWEVTPPYWRLDIALEEDLVEEVARMHGYERIPPKKLTGEVPAKTDQRLFELIFNLKRAFVSAGLTEVQTYSFFSGAALNNFELDRGELIRIANPISQETEFMRDCIWPNLVEVVDKNTRSGLTDIAVFELGKVYKPDNGKPSERYHVAAALLNGTQNPVRELFAILNKALKPLNIEVETELKEESHQDKRFHPTRHLKLKYAGREIGELGEIHPRFINRFGVEKRVAVLEIDLTNLLKMTAPTL